MAVGRELRARHWNQQKQVGIDLLPVGDFAWYDHVLTISLLLGNIPAPITVEWAKYAQSLTDKPVKGMLTGPVTILCWSFPREEVSPETIAKQIALALRDEVADLEDAGIGIIQIDEPALREGLPLRRSEWDAYFQWGIEAFRINAAVVRDDTQIHTHMCYCEFNDIMESIAALDADVITIETSRSDMELLESFKAFAYPNEIGPGVYDIHSHRMCLRWNGWKHCCAKRHSAFPRSACGSSRLWIKNPQLAGDPCCTG